MFQLLLFLWGFFALRFLILPSCSCSIWLDGTKVNHESPFCFRFVSFSLHKLRHSLVRGPICDATSILLWLFKLASLEVKRNWERKDRDLIQGESLFFFLLRAVGIVKIIYKRKSLCWLQCSPKVKKTVTKMYLLIFVLGHKFIPFRAC